jgi:hypothetical protein
MSQYTDRKEAFAKFIADGHMHFINDVLGRPASQAEYSTWLGISPNTLTRLINGQSLPNLENLIPIADKLGPEAYDICGVPRLAFTDPDFSILMGHWATMSKAERRRIVENIEELKQGIVIPNGSTVTA